MKILCLLAAILGTVLPRKLLFSRQDAQNLQNGDQVILSILQVLSEEGMEAYPKGHRLKRNRVFNVARVEGE